MPEHFAFFDFDEARYLVKYVSCRETVADEIENAIHDYSNRDEDREYEDIVADIMNDIDVPWEIVPCRKYWI